METLYLIVDRNQKKRRTMLSGFLLFPLSIGWCQDQILEVENIFAWSSSMGVGERSEGRRRCL
jgi:hypothetical protein